MYKVLIIEDEPAARQNLERNIAKLPDQIEIVGYADSIENGVHLLSKVSFDLLFCDIQLSDGLCFEIFKHVKIIQPVIFTTAYQQYAIKVFQYNSLHYLLKPISFDELLAAWQKFKQNQLNKMPDFQIQELLSQFLPKQYREKLLVKEADKLITLSINDIAYFFADGKNVFAVTINNRQYLIDYTLEKMEQQLKPERFFRINRKFILSLSSISQVYFGSKSKLLIKVQPNFNDEISVSVERNQLFKQWLGM
jgi:DNA-binding LytR/AlgR family response regulator